MLVSDPELAWREHSWLHPDETKNISYVPVQCLNPAITFLCALEIKRNQIQHLYIGILYPSSEKGDIGKFLKFECEVI
jgi:hypothetical protein